MNEPEKKKLFSTYQLPFISPVKVKRAKIVVIFFLLNLVKKNY